MMRPDEVLEDLQLCGLRLLQKQKGFRYGMDTVLLADFVRLDAKAHYADFGTGSGILPLLLHGRGKGAVCEALELQPNFADMASRTMELNSLSGRIHVYCADVREAPALLGSGQLDAVVCNPPYGLPGRALACPEEGMNFARHQQAEGIQPWLKSAHQVLRGKGRLFLIYPAPAMLQIMRLLEDIRLAPKRFRLIYPAADRAANLVLIEAVKDGRPMLEPCPPLIVYTPQGEMTPELRRIYHMEPEET